MGGMVAEERVDGGAFAPVVRTRLLERLAASATYPISLVIAPAGYGKSVALRHFLASLGKASVRFALRAEHATLLSFLRGFAEALYEHAPHVTTTLAGAYERAGSSSTAGADLAQWVHVHLESFDGVIAVDDLHLADSDPEVVRFLTALIERTKPAIRWIVASRSTTGLPVGTWLAYRDSDTPIDESDLRFTEEEIKEAASSLGVAMRDDELTDLRVLTEGWPAAVSFALRTSTRSTDLRNVSALTREMIYRLLAEQVYANLDSEERELLEVAIQLPSIEVAILENAGFDRALTIVERLREGTAFIYADGPGVYQCHDLFREFLRRQSALAGRRSQRMVNQRAARALESSGDIEHAIVGYVAAGSLTDIVRLLERHGFDLIERARGDVVGHAIEALDEKTRRENARVLALHGALQAICGKFARAESLFRRALARAASDRDLVATTSLRLASLMANQGKSTSALLSTVGSDLNQHPFQRAEALSLLAAQQAVARNTSAAHDALRQLEPLFEGLDEDAVQAKVLHRMGIAFHNLGIPDKAFRVLRQSSELAASLHLYSLASRVDAVLSNAMLHENDDVTQQIAYADLAVAAAMKAGDAFALQTALLQLLSGQMRLGNVEACIALEQRLSTVHAGDLSGWYLGLFRSERLAWEGRFGEAHRLLSTCWTRMSFDFDRSIYGAKYALFLALDGEEQRSRSVVQEILGPETSTVTGLYRIRSTTIAKTLTSLAEAINGRITAAERILRSVKPEGDQVISAITNVIAGLNNQLQQRASIGNDRIRSDLDALVELAYADIARLLKAVHSNVTERLNDGATPGLLTKAELDVVKLLADGLTPKEIAGRTGRSVFTIRVHIANVSTKLDCRGRSGAVRRAQQLGLI
jgi:ATP/maltotriose-dependent transcriptional regulator MalT